MHSQIWLLIALLQNLGLLALVVIGHAVIRYTPRLPRAISQILIGVLFGSAAIVTMSASLRVAPGRFLDVRGVILALAGPFGGSIGAVVAATAAGIYRWQLGGVGASPALISIVATTAGGILFKRHKGSIADWGWADFFLLGLCAVVGALSGLILIELPIVISRLRVVAAPFGAVTVLGVVLLGRLLAESERRHELLRSLAETAERFATVFHSASNYLLLLDLRGTVLQANDSALRIGGFRKDDIGRMVWDITWWEDNGFRNELRRLVRAAATGHAEHGQAFVQSPERAIVDFSITRSASAQGCEPFLLLDARDITELLNQQEQIRRSERLTAIGQLASGIAHEFNNLLFIITGNAEFALHKCDSSPIHDALKKIAWSARQGRELTHKLLCFGRRQIMTPRPVDVVEIARTVVELTRPLIPDNVCIDLRIDGGPLQATVEASQMEVALINLILNARDALPDGGLISIDLSEESVDPGEAARMNIGAGRYVSVIVSDNGLGMAPEIAARVFEPFFTTKPVGQGTGLGLSIVHGFAQQSKGYLTIETERGVGTAVRLILPAASSSQSAETQVAEGRLWIPDGAQW